MRFLSILILLFLANSSHANKICDLLLSDNIKKFKIIDPYSPVTNQKGLGSCVLHQKCGLWENALKLNNVLESGETLSIDLFNFSMFTKQLYQDLSLSDKLSSFDMNTNDMKEGAGFYSSIQIKHLSLYRSKDVTPKSKYIDLFSKANTHDNPWFDYFDVYYHEAFKYLIDKEIIDKKTTIDRYGNKFFKLKEPYLSEDNKSELEEIIYKDLFNHVINKVFNLKNKIDSNLLEGIYENSFSHKASGLDLNKKTGLEIKETLINYLDNGIFVEASFSGFKIHSDDFKITLHHEKGTTRDQLKGGHRVNITGYFESNDGFFLIIKNSWGENRGKSGYYALNFNEIKNFYIQRYNNYSQSGSYEFFFKPKMKEMNAK